MKYIIDSILKQIDKQKPSKQEQLRIRLCGFENVRIYEAVAKRLHEKYDDALDVETRLSKEKYAEFKNNPSSDQTALMSLEAHNWIAATNSLTYYRNLPIDKAQLIVIMGTEAVDDQGGLSDFYYIDPEKLVRNLDQNYFDVFKRTFGDWPENDTKTVNKLYNDLFALVPINISKLSDLADRWGQIALVQDFVERFYAELPKWGLCITSDSIRTQNKILKSEKANLLQTNYDFITRKLFRSMTRTQYNKYLQKVEKCRTEQHKYDDSWDGWRNQSLTSLQSYTDILCMFIRGEDISENRQKLPWVDFSVTEYVLGITLPHVIQPKRKKSA